MQSYEYALLIIICLTIPPILYVRMIYSFWSHQPICHTYDFIRPWTLPREAILLETAPTKRKFCDFYHVKTRKYHDITNLEKQTLVHFLQANYISSESVLHMISATTLDQQMTGFMQSPAVSIYFDYDYTTSADPPTDPPTDPLEQALEALQQIRCTPRIQGCMLSTQIILYDPAAAAPTTTPLYYWNYICTKRTSVESNKQTQQLIQTHDYNIRLFDNRGTLFKKEIFLCEGVVPLLQYRSYSYIIAPRFQLRPLSPFITIHQLRKSDVGTMITCLTLSKKRYILPEIGNIYALIDNHELFVFSLKHRDEIYGMYFVKNANMHYDGIEGGDIGAHAGNAIQLVASVKQVYSDELFVLGWEHVLQTLLKIRNTYRVLLVDEMADNGVILGSLNRSLAFQSNVAAYYLYNYAMYGMPFQANGWAIVV